MVLFCHDVLVILNFNKKGKKMQLSVKGKCLEIYERPIFLDKETGEAKETTYGLVILFNEKLKNGQFKPDTLDIKVDKETAEKFKSKKGQDIEIPVNLYSKSAISLSAV